MLALVVMVGSLVALTLTLARFVRPATSPPEVAVEVLEKRAYDEYARKDYAAALATCEEMLRRDWQCANARYVKGLVFKARGQRSAARLEFGVSAELYPPESDGRFLAECQLKETAGEQ